MSKRELISRAIICSILLSSCSSKLTTIQDLSTEERATVYNVLNDVPYGSDAEQKMDIYVSTKASSYGKRNLTIIFLHGGGYYLSDKTQEEKYIEPYLRKGLNVVNLNYRLKRGIPLATSDLTYALNFLKANTNQYNLNPENIIVTGFSAGAHIATNVGLSQNNPEFPYRLNNGITITGIINISGPVDGLDIVERIFTEHDNELLSKVGKAMFPAEGYESKENIAIYEPITWFDKNDPPVFLWQGGLDDQIPPVTFKRFVPLLRKNKDVYMYVPEGRHGPNEEEFKNAYVEIVKFLNDL